VVEYLLGTIIKKLLKSDVSMWDSFKTSKMRISIMDALTLPKNSPTFTMTQKVSGKGRNPNHFGEGESSSETPTHLMVRRKKMALETPQEKG
jgi:hypothetical protein